MELFFFIFIISLFASKPQGQCSRSIKRHINPKAKNPFIEDIN